MTITLSDELRQVAANLDRAASISAQYCCSKHHTDAIRRAAARLEELEGAAQLAVRALYYAEGRMARTAHDQLAALLAAPGGATP